MVLFVLVTLFVVIVGSESFYAVPVPLRSDITIRHILNPGAFRIALNPVDQHLYVLTFDGDVLRIELKEQGEISTATTLYSNLDHNLVSVAGMAFGPDGTLYLSGNREDGKFNIATIVKGQLVTPESVDRTWVVLAETEPYPLKRREIFNHKVNGIVVSPDGQFVFVNSGSRTDHGELRDYDGTFPDLREAPLTSVILRIPSGGENITIPNDTEELKNLGYLFADGVRNTFDLAFAPNGDLFGTENSADRDDPEELNWIREGHHYGFPWRMGTTDNPQQFPEYDPSGDLLLPPDFAAVKEGSYHNDPSFPSPPAAFTDPVVNLGPDADKFRDPADGLVKDASDLGLSLATFTAHRSPLGLVFDVGGVLDSEFHGDGFVLSWTKGDENSDPGNGPFFDASEDLLHLDLTKNESNYEARVTRIVANFQNPVDAEIIGNKIYVLETGGSQGLWEIAFGETPPSLTSEINDLVVDNPNGGEKLGMSVSISGNTLVAGAPGAVHSGSTFGAAYVFERDINAFNRWGVSAKVMSENGHEYDGFGNVVSLSGDLLGIGAPQALVNGARRGAAYIFQRDPSIRGQWNEIAKFSPDDLNNGAFFGFSTALQGNTLVVGAHLAVPDGVQTGAVYVFEQQEEDSEGSMNWVQTSKLVPEIEGNRPEFGFSVAVDGNKIVIGAPYANGNAYRSGAAFVYRRDRITKTWTFETKLVAVDAFENNGFGQAVSIHGNSIVVTSTRDNRSGLPSGQAYIFEKTEDSNFEWIQVNRIVGETPESATAFGFSASLNGDFLCIGAPTARISEGVFGSGYIFRRNFEAENDWGQDQLILPPFFIEETHFGGSIAMSGTTVAFGAPWASVNALADGFIRVIELGNEDNRSPEISVVTVLSLNPITEDEVDPPGTSLEELFAQIDPGTISNADGDSIGLAITGVSDDHGSWEIRLDHDASWRPLDGVSEDSVRLLTQESEIRFIPNPDFNGLIESALTFRLWDQTIGSVGNSGDSTRNGGFTAFSPQVLTAKIHVDSIEDPPALITNHGIVVDNASNAVILTNNLLETIDVDGELSENLIYTLQVAPGLGFLRLNGANLSTGASFSQADINNNRVDYIQTAKILRGVDTAELIVNDSTLLFTDPFEIRILLGEFSPVIAGTSSPALNAIAEDQLDNPGTQISDLLSIISASISDENGDSPGVAITNTDVTFGSWEFKLDEIDVWNIIDNDLETKALLLPPDSKIRFQPQKDFGGEIQQAITFRLWDQTFGNPGKFLEVTPILNAADRIAFSDQEISASLLVNPVNDAPKLAANHGLSVFSQQFGTIGDHLLRAEDVEDKEANLLTYSLITLPRKGELFLVDIPLSLGDHFTQEDINFGFLRYRSKADEPWGDSFQFKVADNEDLESLPHTFSIFFGIGYRQTTQILPEGENSFAQFGHSLALDEDTLVVGKFGRNLEEEPSRGTAQVYARDASNPDQWLSVATLISDDDSGSDAFGFSVAIHENTIVIGALWDGVNGSKSGAAYIFDRNHGGPNNWGRIAKIIPEDGAEAAHFGRAVAVHGSTLVVGAFLDDTIAEDSGSAYVFEKTDGGDNEWIEVVKLTADDGEAGDLFGWSIALEGNSLAIGAFRDDDKGVDAGAVYVFERDESLDRNWLLAAKLTADDGGPNDLFGHRVAIDGDRIVTGAHFDDIQRADWNIWHAGSAYVFERDSQDSRVWHQSAKLIANDPESNDLFGWAVGIKGNTIGIGAWSSFDNGTIRGAVYAFEQKEEFSGRWGQVAKLTVEGIGFDNDLGRALALDGQTIIAGAQRDDTSAFNAGSVYVFQLEPNNTPPVLNSTAPALFMNIAEDDRENNGTLVSEIVSSLESGTIVDPDSDEFGIAVTSVDESLGIWEFSRDGGATWHQIWHVSEDAPLFFLPNARIRFIPMDNFNGLVEAGIHFFVWDLTVGSSLGLSSVTITANLQVDPVDDPPIAYASFVPIVIMGNTVLLDGQGSSNVEGGALQFHWEIIDGPPGNLIDANSATPEFLAPIVETETITRFRLIVSSNGLESDPFEFEITIIPKPQFSFEKFDGNSSLQLNGDTQIMEDRLRLTPDLDFLTGSAWYGSRLSFPDAFETVFQFQLSGNDGTDGADGFAFVIHNDHRGLASLGRNSWNLGYEGIVGSVAVEFDTFQNTSESSANEISIQMNGSRQEQSLGSVSPETHLNDGNVHTVRIRYREERLEVFLNDLTTPIVSAALDLPGLLDCPNNLGYAGFTAATGGLSQFHDILNWSFQPVFAVNDHYEADENTQLTIPSDRGVFANDIGIDSMIAEARLGEPPVKGELTLHADGSFVFDPKDEFETLNQDQIETVFFTYSLNSEEGIVSNTARSTIRIQGSNDPPIAEDILFTLPFNDTSETISFKGVDIDLGDVFETLEFKFVEVPSDDDGLVENHQDGRFTFHPGDNLVGLKENESKEVSFTYVVMDLLGAESNEAIVTIVAQGMGSPWTFTPSEIAFGDVSIEASGNSACSLTVLLRNLSSRADSILSTSTDNPAFQVNNVNTEINAGDFIFLEIAFRPNTIAHYSGNLIVQTSSRDVIIPLSGKGVDVPNNLNIESVSLSVSFADDLVDVPILLNNQVPLVFLSWEIRFDSRLEFVEFDTADRVLMAPTITGGETSVLITLSDFEGNSIIEPGTGSLGKLRFKMKENVEHAVFPLLYHQAINAQAANLEFVPIAGKNGEIVIGNCEACPYTIDVDNDGAINFRDIIFIYRHRFNHLPIIPPEVLLPDEESIETVTQRIESLTRIRCDGFAPLDVDFDHEFNFRDIVFIFRTRFGHNTIPDGVVLPDNVAEEDVRARIECLLN